MGTLNRTPHYFIKKVTKRSKHVIGFVMCSGKKNSPQIGYKLCI